MQQAAYSLIPNKQKQGTHLKIGRLLLQNLSPEKQESQFFTIVNHWNQARSLVTKPAEKEQLIQLNFKAGKKAKGSAAYAAAFAYFQTALSFLDSDSWSKDYSLTLELHEAKAEAAYLTGKFTEMETAIAPVLIHVKDILDRVEST